MPRMQAEQMVYMAVFVFGVINIYRPLHELTVTTHLIGNQIVQYVLPLFTFFSVYSQYFAGIDGIQQNFANDGMYEGGSLIYRSVFGRGGWGGCVSAVRAMPQVVYGKVGTAFNQVIPCFFQEFFVACVVIVILYVSS